ASPFRVAVVQLTRNVRLLDLAEGGAWLAGSVAALTKLADRVFTQEWARYFYEQDGSYGVVEGLRYANAHNDALAYALYERAGALRVVADLALSDPALEPELAAIALELHMVLA